MYACDCDMCVWFAHADLKVLVTAYYPTEYRVVQAKESYWRKEEASIYIMKSYGNVHKDYGVINTQLYSDVRSMLRVRIAGQRNMKDMHLNCQKNERGSFFKLENGQIALMQRLVQYQVPTYP